MGVVTIHAVVPFAAASAKVPVAGHATVAAVFEVAILRAMALGAEFDDVDK